MNSYRAKAATSLPVFIAAATVVIFMLATRLTAQRNNPRLGTPEAARAREIALREGELRRTSIEMGAKKIPTIQNSYGHRRLY